jgi:hypothetical protein
MSKYRELKNLSIKMANELPQYRPHWEEILMNQNLWAFNVNVLDIVKTLNRNKNENKVYNYLKKIF